MPFHVKSSNITSGELLKLGLCYVIADLYAGEHFERKILAFQNEESALITWVGGGASKNGAVVKSEHWDNVKEICINAKDFTSLWDLKYVGNRYNFHGHVEDSRDLTVTTLTEIKEKETWRGKETWEQLRPLLMEY